MKWTTKHWFQFEGGSKVGKCLIQRESWDVLYNDDDPTNFFAIPADKHVWIDRCLQTPDLLERAKDIASVINNLGKCCIVSVGVGGAGLEFYLKCVAPPVELVVTDWSPKAVERLKKVFSSVTVEQFDMLSGTWSRYKGTLVLAHRVDTEFDNKQWNSIFSNMSNQGVEYVLFVPSAFLTFRIYKNEKKTLLRCLLKRSALTFAGWLRTKDTFLGLWIPYYKVLHELPIGQLTGFLLQKN